MSEIKESLESLKAQVAEIEYRIASIEQEEAVEETAETTEIEEDMSPIDISIDDEMMDSVDFGGTPSIEADAEPEPDEVLLSAPVENINDKQEKKKAKKAVMDVMVEKCAWKTAMPGSPVKNIISAISLNDRVLLINTLFKEDAIAFQDAISTLNGMSSFAEAEAYIIENHPDWNLNSDIVYRLMMAIRRKLK
ncbi:MAG: hypothetical protein Q4G10_06095 [Bacteroidia bacterium]|nr:hypothetical protein [Bacteroidia bacterium]